MSAEPPTTVQPLHRLGLGSPRCQHSRTGTLPVERAIPCVRLQELPRRAQGLAPVASESAYPRHRINPVSALCAGQTRRATSTPPTEEGAPATTGAPTSHRIRRDRRVTLVHGGQDRSTDHAAIVTSTGLEHTASAHKTPRSEHMYHPYPPFNYKRE